jgi:spermidine synthase
LRVPRRGLLFVLFTASGFAGLIYESIWSHYLKLFLGHAAYAQSLVLALFMGGMAGGAWLASRFGARAGNLLRAYAAVEALIGLASLAFHPIFVATTEAAYNLWLPALGSSGPAAVFKVVLAGALLLPQSVLLGATFPLMSAGLLRRHPSKPGETLAVLYFTNSFGAALGVLVSGFVLIDKLGLPGTMQAAGLMNLALAAMVWLLSPGRDARLASAMSQGAVSRLNAAPHYRLLVAVALLTGAASFIYEIGWIRMLSLVLGSATHSFELMLSAFIFGLAFGGLWVRQRLDRMAEPVRFLARVQVVMGLLALATLPLYGVLFELMQLVVRGTAKTGAGYAMFLAASHGIALLVMFPAAFCAGMTLPLLSSVLFASPAGERAIGTVYAANTLGAIVGVVTAAHMLMPMLGVKGLMVCGAALDVALGLVLLVKTRRIDAWTMATAVMAAGVFAWVLFGVTLEPYRMASGVFRRGELYGPRDATLEFYRDGRTASVSLMQFPEGLSLRTNGKSDGAINLGEGPRISDEVTMVLTGALPLAYKPEATSAAVIGMGTGLTTHTLLSSPRLTRVDTIEIEPAMAAASRHFAMRNANTWADPRSHVAFDDAKTYFSTHNRKYDIVVSEPSNPWVSGVSSLFTGEFYRHVKRYLNEGGVLVQWFQLYEMDLALMASVLQALGEQFEDYAVYASTDSDVLIVAGDRRTLARPLANPQEIPALAQELRKVEVNALGDLAARRLGGKRALAPLFLSYGVPVNSDFAPFLDLHAARHRFLRSSAEELTHIGMNGIPVVALVEGVVHPFGTLSYAGSDFLERIEWARRAEYARRFYLETSPPAPVGIPVELEKNLELSKMRGIDCIDPEHREVWLQALFQVQKLVNSGLDAPSALSIWRRFETAPCFERLGAAEQRWLQLYAAVARRDGVAMGTLADKILGEGRELTVTMKQYLLTASLAGHLLSGDYEQGMKMWNAHVDDVARAGIDLNLRYLYAWLAYARAAR